MRRISTSTRPDPIHVAFDSPCDRLPGLTLSKEYLTDVLTRLPAMLAKDAVTLPPANWLAARSGKPEREAA